MRQATYAIPRFFNSPTTPCTIRATCSGSIASPTRPAAAERLVGKAFGGEQALDLVAELDEALLLRRRDCGWRPRPVLKPRSCSAGAEAFGELGRVEHRVEQRQQAVLQVAGFVELAGDRQVVELARDLGHDAAGGVGAAVAADRAASASARRPSR